MPKVIILDTTSGVVRGGHDTDDLNALTEALAPYRASRLAPYKDYVSCARSRIGRLRLFTRSLCNLIRGQENCIVVVQSASRLELLALAAFNVFQERVRLLIVLRREFYGAGWLGFVFRYVITSMIRRNRWIFASYSRLVLEFWQKQSGRSGCLLAFPRKPIPSGWRKAYPDALTFSLLGAMRWDKGAAYYDRLIEQCVALGHDCRVIVQCYTQDSTRPDPDLAMLGRILRERWSRHGRVQLVGESLSFNEYAALLAETDIGLFPYDVAAYGGGDSGVLHEILTMGKIAVATPIAWAKSAFVEHPNLIFIDDPSGEHVVRALGEAYRRARAMPRGDLRRAMPEDLFGQSWRVALSKAVST